MNTRAGRFRHLVTIESKATTVDENGQASGTWSTVATLRAMVEALTGGEKWLQDLNLGSVTHQLTMRYYPGITRKMRVSWGDKVLAIENVIPDERNRGMRLQCTEKV